MTLNHTPGPWYYVYGAAWTAPDGPDNNGSCVAVRALARDIPPVERDANMRLCAAAPDLLSALIALLPFAQPVGANDCSSSRFAAIDAARAAIAKAGG